MAYAIDRPASGSTRSLEIHSEIQRQTEIISRLQAVVSNLHSRLSAVAREHSDPTGINKNVALQNYATELGRSVGSNNDGLGLVVDSLSDLLDRLEV
jgi:hypothetical protein